MGNNQHKIASMSGKQVVITGPTSGIGKEIACQLAALGAEIVLACRDIKRGEQAADEIALRTGMKSCVVMRIDTSSQESIRDFVLQYRTSYSRLDVLINNAGINSTRRQTSVDGLELTFATNVLGYHLLTQELLGLLRASAPSRIVNVASTFAKYFDLEDLQFDRRPYVGRKAYAQSKACNRMLTRVLASSIEGSGVTANSMAPGFVQTELYRDVSSTLRFIMRLAGLAFGNSVTEGADTAVWLASDSAVKNVNGGFFERRQEIPCKFKNEGAEKALWRYCNGAVRAGTGRKETITP